MKLFATIARQPNNRHQNRHSASRRSWNAIRSLCAGIVLLASAACLPVHADTPPYEIYLYNAQGAPVDVTSSYYSQNGYVYTNSGTLIGTASYQKGHIYDLSGNDIGLIVANNDNE
jgi:hypothetical protein